MFYHYTGFCIYLGILYLLPLGSPSWVSDWAFAESGCTFAHWEPGLIPLNKICSKKTFLNKIKQAKKKKKSKFIDLYLTVWNCTKPWIQLSFILVCYVNVKCLRWLEFITIFFFFYTQRNKCIFLSFCMFVSDMLHFLLCLVL